MNIGNIASKAKLMGLGCDIGENCVLIIDNSRKILHIHNNGGKHVSKIERYVIHKKSKKGYLAVVVKRHVITLILLIDSQTGNIIHEIDDTELDNFSDAKLCFKAEESIEKYKHIGAILYSRGDIHIISSKGKYIGSMNEYDKYSAVYIQASRNREYITWGNRDIILKRDGSGLLCKFLRYLEEYLDSCGNNGESLLTHDCRVICNIGFNANTQLVEGGNILCRYNNKKDEISLIYPVVMRENGKSNIVKSNGIEFEELKLASGYLYISGLKVNRNIRLFPITSFNEFKYNVRIQNFINYLGCGLFCISDALSINPPGDTGWNHVYLIYNLHLDKVVQAKFEFKYETTLKISEADELHITAQTLTVSEDSRNYLTHERIGVDKKRLFEEGSDTVVNGDNNIKYYPEKDTRFRIDWDNIKETQCILKYTDNQWRFYSEGTKEELDLWEVYS